MCIRDRVPPLPIPNREVKLTCADGTAMPCGRVGSRLLLSRASDFELSLIHIFYPYDNQGLSSIMYVSVAKDKAVFYWWKLVNIYNVHLPRVKIACLDENKMYKVKELDAVSYTHLDVYKRQQ